MNNLFSNSYYQKNSHIDFDIVLDELNENSKYAEHPDCKIQLKPHQLTLLQECINYENNVIKIKDKISLSEICDEDDEIKTKIGIIGDKVGSGKSYVILSLLLSNNITHNTDIISRSFGYNNVNFSMKQKKITINTNLLVIPHNITNQWINYIEKFSDKISYCVINKQKLLQKYIDEEENISDKNLIVITSTFYNKFASYIDEKNLKLQRVIYDEVDNLNIVTCRPIDSKFYWLVTASYGNILYPRGYSKWDNILRKDIRYATGITASGFIKSILLDISANVPKSLFKVLVLKNNDNFIETSLNLPEMNRIIVKCKTPSTINILYGLVDHNIIRALNGNDVKTALEYIRPSQKCSENNIINILIEKYTRQLINLDLKLNMTNELIFETDEEKNKEIDKIEKKKNELNNKIDLIKERIKTNNTCGICFEEIDKKTITNCCQNSFCFKCINLWMNQKQICPYCKTILTTDTIYIVKNENETEIENEIENNNILSEENDKTKNLEILLKNRKPNSKFLIFSDYDEVFKDIYYVLQKLNIHWDELKGNTGQINGVLNRYKNGNVDILTVKTKQYGSGLNLENTTDIIMLHKFDTEMEKQVIGRAQRFGRNNRLNVWYLLYDNEYKNNSL